MLRLVNRYEEIAHGEIKVAADRFGLAVYPKVRVADVIDLDEVGAIGDLKRYGLQAHFDFIICRDSWNPAYAIEFDGHYHTTPQQQARDAKKDQLCKAGGLPILRINSNHLTKAFGRLTLLGWLIDVAELQLAFDAEQEAGRISWEEGFDPLNLMSTTPGEDQFPYWISARAGARLERLHKQGRIAHPMGSGFFGRDANDVYRGMQLIAVTEAEGVYVTTAMRRQQFPAPFGELLSEILSVELTDRVDRWLADGVGAEPLEAIYRRAADMRPALRLGGAHSYGPVTDLWMRDGF
jgi:hypothetical protein